MSGTIEAVDWKESAEELHALYKAKRGVEARKRLGVLWLLRRGESVTRAAETAGVGRRTLTRWLSWCREGGLEEVLSVVCPGTGRRVTSADCPSTTDGGSCSSGRAAGSFAPTRKPGGGWSKSTA